MMGPTHMMAGGIVPKKIAESAVKFFFFSIFAIINPFISNPAKKERFRKAVKKAEKIVYFLVVVIFTCGVFAFFSHGLYDKCAAVTYHHVGFDDPFLAFFTLALIFLTLWICARWIFKGWKNTFFAGYLCAIIVSPVIVFGIATGFQTIPWIAGLYWIIFGIPFILSLRWPAFKNHWKKLVKRSWLAWKNSDKVYLLAVVMAWLAVDFEHLLYHAEIISERVVHPIVESAWEFISNLPHFGETGLLIELGIILVPLFLTEIISSSRIRRRIKARGTGFLRDHQGFAQAIWKILNGSKTVWEEKETGKFIRALMYFVKKGVELTFSYISYWRGVVKDFYREEIAQRFKNYFLEPEKKNNNNIQE